jgi:hypothetical protein
MKYGENAFGFVWGAGISEKPPDAVLRACLALLLHRRKRTEGKA